MALPLSAPEDQDLIWLDDFVRHVIYDKRIVTSELLGSLGIDIVTKLRSQIERDTTTNTRQLGKLWASDLGESCPTKLWLDFNWHSVLSYNTSGSPLRFMYGDIVESLLLYLLKEAGYEITREQERIEIEVEDWVVSGRIDACINGKLVDIKSCSSYAYNKYRSEAKVNHKVDTFGYRSQLLFYQSFLPGYDPSNVPALVFVNKENGAIMSREVEIPIPEAEQVSNAIKVITKLVEYKEAPKSPKHIWEYKVKDNGMKVLNSKCSFCKYKTLCHSYRSYQYSTGTVDIVDMGPNKEPRVPFIGENSACLKTTL